MCVATGVRWKGAVCAANHAGGSVVVKLLPREVCAVVSRVQVSGLIQQYQPSSAACIARSKDDFDIKAGRTSL